MNRPTRTLKEFYDDPEFQAMKAARRAVSHQEAVQESAWITKTQWKLMNKYESAKVDLNAILRTLIAKRIPFVLTGTHAIGGWTGRPRATKDVDILVKGGRNHARAVKAIKALYPQLEAKAFYGVTGFFIPGDKQSLIDVMYPHRPDLAETLAHPIWVEDQGLRYRIPTREAIMANKYGAMLNLKRDPGKKAIDAADFYFMVGHSMDEGQQPIDLAKLASLGEMVWPGGGGEEILRLVEQAKAGRVPTVEPNEGSPSG